ncbi:GSCOCG00002417001-RA-CDS [Cotesia congregata]|nr:GSCOCG00002417001-RA-CDS [Cotesia congregata]
MNSPIVSGDILDDEGYKPRFVRRELNLYYP